MTLLAEDEFSAESKDRVCQLLIKMQMSDLGLFIVRAVFVAVAVGLGAALINSNLLPKEDLPWAPWAAIGGMTALALGLIRMDIAVGRKELQTVTAIYFGLIVGVFLTYIVRLALLPIFPDLGDAKLTPAVAKHQQLGQFIVLIIGMVLCYLCVSILMQTKDDFSLHYSLCRVFARPQGPQAADPGYKCDHRRPDCRFARNKDT